MTKPIPEGFHTITPTFVFKDCRKAIAFYKKAFGAMEQEVMPSPDGRGIMHASLRIGDSTIMMGEERPDCWPRAPRPSAARPFRFTSTSRTSTRPFNGPWTPAATYRCRSTTCFGATGPARSDPFGYSWMLATHIKDLSPDEIAEGAKRGVCRHGKVESSLPTGERAKRKIGNLQTC